MIQINDAVRIQDEELVFSASRSGGPGGQNVNKVNTRVTLEFDLEHSPAFDEAQRALLRQRLATRLTKEGVLRVVAQVHRSQAANREEALARFVRLLQAALKPRAPRRPTAVPAATKRARLDQKIRRGRLKQHRTKPAPAEE